MQNVSSADLKTIPHSKRANLYYLEHCRVLVNGTAGHAQAWTRSATRRCAALASRYRQMKHDATPARRCL